MLALFTKLRETYSTYGETLDAAITAAKTDSFSEELIDKLVVLSRCDDLAPEDKKQLLSYLDEIIYCTHEKYNDDMDPAEEDDSDEQSEDSA